ncbi:hypothetical protein [Stanieria cyanosphaera]|nr:hypothetical protein [Stanieria cyanosphaera]
MLNKRHICDYEVAAGAVSFAGAEAIALGYKSYLLIVNNCAIVAKKLQ